jgi:hypothetical protein
MEKQNGFVEKLKNPTLILTGLGIFYMLSVAYNSIEDVKQRQSKKIAIQNEIIEELNLHKLQEQKNYYELKIELLELKLEMKEEIHQVELKITKEHN